MKFIKVINHATKQKLPNAATGSAINPATAIAAFNGF
jgi:hypothetical protein